MEEKKGSVDGVQAIAALCVSGLGSIRRLNSLVHLFYWYF